MAKKTISKKRTVQKVNKNPHKKTRDFLDASYKSNKHASKVAKKHGYTLDKELSGSRHKVFVNKKGEPTAVYRGTKTKRDVIAVAGLATGLFKHTKRYKQTQKDTKKIKEKYKGKSLTAAGHSLGGKLAEGVGAKKVITYNKAIGIKDIGRKRSKGQVDIRNKLDPVSALSFTQREGKNTSRNHSFKQNKLNSHSIPKKI